MDVPKTKSSHSAKPPARAEPKNTSHAAPKSPKDGLQARQSPKETKSAAQNAFGPLPQNEGARQSGNSADMPASPASNASPKAPFNRRDAVDPKRPASQPGDTVKDAQGSPVKTPDGRDVILDKNKNPVPVDLDGKVMTDPMGNSYGVDSTGKYLETPDGKYGVYDKDGKRVAADPATGEISKDANGNPLMVRADGNYATADNGEPVVYDKANAGVPVAIDPATGNAVADAKGNIRAVDDDGNFITTPQGDTVVYDKTGNKYNLMATDKEGNPMVLNGFPAAVDKDGNFRQAETGESLVYDKRGNPVMLGEDGKIVTDDRGNALAVGPDGKRLTDVVYDKATGFRVKTAMGEPQANDQGMPYFVDENGKMIADESGKPAVYDPRGLPVQPQGTATPSGFEIYKDANTGEQVGVKDDYVFKVDEQSGDLARDADGNLLPPLYDPVNSDPTRPPVRPNDDPDTMLRNLPRGTERGDPMTIKGELFDEAGNLSQDKLYEAAAKYDARDIYDALINAGKHGGWDNLPRELARDGTIVHPDEDLARQAIATLIAWQNENGKYNPLKEGKLPPIVFYKGKPLDDTGYASTGTGATYINIDSISGSETGTIMHELNHASTSRAFKDIYGPGSHQEVVTEYLATNWTGNPMDSGYEMDGSYPIGMKSLEVAVKKMGDGNIDKGLDLLKRAYFSGDPVALEQLKKYFPPGENFIPPDYSEYEPGDPNYLA